VLAVHAGARMWCSVSLAEFGDAKQDSSTESSAAAGSEGGGAGNGEARRAVLLRNVFSVADAKSEPNFVRELEEDLQTECSKCGGILAINVLTHGEVPPPIDAPCTQGLRHGDLIHARKALTGAAAAAAALAVRVGAAAPAYPVGTVVGAPLANRGQGAVVRAQRLRRARPGCVRPALCLGRGRAQAPPLLVVGAAMLRL
jgi:hypothetical protein